MSFHIHQKELIIISNSSDSYAFNYRKRKVPFDNQNLVLLAHHRDIEDNYTFQNHLKDN